MEGVIEGGAHQVVHGRVQHQEAPPISALIDLNDPAQQHAGVGGHQTARLEGRLDVQPVQDPRGHGDIVGGRGGFGLAVVGHAQAATEVEAGDAVALRAQGLGHLAQHAEGVFQRRQVGDLAADMAGQAHGRGMRRA
ncbi:hypothetical protein D3C85_994410 [compost metagenome]